MRRRHGFTLVELLVSVAVLGVVLVYLLRTFTVQHRTYAVVDEVSEMQQNARTVADLMARDLRHAGLMVPEGAAVCGIDNASSLTGIQDGTDVLFVSDADAIMPGTAKVADFGADLPTSVTNVTAPGATTLDVDALVAEGTFQAAYDLDADGTNDSDFRPGAGVIVADVNDPTRGAACGIVTAQDAAATEIDVTMLTGALRTASVPASLTAVPAHVYAIDDQSRLVRNGDVLAENVDDLQLAYFFDANDNGVEDSGETWGISSKAYGAAASGLQTDTLRDVRFNLVMRTRYADPEHGQGQFQVTENSATTPAADGFRRRVHTATVRLRNMGAR
jgi:prepilin-type N-terminal cleavage/methylation domain-containing protein